MSPGATSPKESKINVNTVILGLLLGLSSYHLKKLNDGLDKIHVVERSVAVGESQLSDIKEKMKQRDTQWEKLESGISELKYKVASLARTE